MVGDLAALTTQVGFCCSCFEEQKSMPALTRPPWVMGRGWGPLPGSHVWCLRCRLHLLIWPAWASPWTATPQSRASWSRGAGSQGSWHLSATNEGTSTVHILFLYSLKRNTNRTTRTKLCTLCGLFIWINVIIFLIWKPDAINSSVVCTCVCAPLYTWCGRDLSGTNILDWKSGNLGPLWALPPTVFLTLSLHSLYH